MRYEIALEVDRKVVLQELSVQEFEACLRTKQSGGGTGDGWELTQEGLRRSLIEDAGKALTYADLDGAKLAGRFSTRQLLLLRQAWDRIHTPSPEDLQRLGGMRVVAT